MFADRDPGLHAWISDRGARLSLAFSTAIQFFNPDAIVVGGFFRRELLEALSVRVELSDYDIADRKSLNKPVLEISMRQVRLQLPKRRGFWRLLRGSLDKFR